MAVADVLAASDGESLSREHAARQPATIKAAASISSRSMQSSRQQQVDRYLAPVGYARLDFR
jgi:hypothetical protein